MPENELTTFSDENELIAAPDFGNEAVVGMETVDEVVRPPYLRIVQPLSNPLIEKGFKAGDVVLRPADEKMPEKFIVTPVLLYSEFLCVNPPNSNPLVREKSLDSKSGIADKCRNMVEEEIDGKKVSYQQNLSYLLWIWDLDMLALCTFYRAEFKTGSNFASKIKLRKQSIFAGRYKFEVSKRSNDKGAWYAFNISNDPEKPWIDKAEYDKFKAMHEEYASKLEKIQVDSMNDGYEDNDNVEIVDNNLPTE